MTNTLNNELLVNLPNLNDDQLTELRKWLISHLVHDQLTVTFTKKDGTTRVMKCTLDPGKVPAQEIKESTKERKENLDTIRVFDMEAAAWRSFTVKNVKQVSL